MARLSLVILRKRFDLSEVVLGSLLREEPEGTVTRAFELTMRHLFFLFVSPVKVVGIGFLG
jgi:hypothetical protein